MKKRYKMIDLDCANCAAKMEDAIRKLTASMRYPSAFSPRS